MLFFKYYIFLTVFLYICTFDSMKKLVYLVVCLIMISCSTVINEDVNINIDESTESSSTELRIVNPTKDYVLVYLTLSGYPSSDTVHVKSVKGIFGCLQSGLVGSFYIPAHDSVSYTSTKWLSGNIGFGTQPMNCTVTAWPTGANPFEFNLNNNQESIDISAMGGVNCILNVDLLGGPQWQASAKYPNVRYMYNDSMWKNSGLIGVYPYGCTNCTNTEGKQSCQSPNEQPNSEPICTPTRSAGVHGGIVRVSFLGYTNIKICK